jgi:hypothetical protein
MSERMTDFAWRVSLAGLALPLLILFAEPAAAFSETGASARTAKQLELEKGVLEVTKMFQNDPRYNRGKTPEQIKDGVEFVTGNVLFVLAHETAHALISVFEIPVIGREEDGADALATIVALKMSSTFADRVVINAARGWFLSEQRDKKENIPTLFYDEHGLDLQRAYNIVCLLVGGAPDKFMSLAQEVKLPEARQRTCRFDFSNASWSWEEVLKPHMRKPDDPKTEIQVSYAPTHEFAALAEIGRKLQILEAVAEWLSEDFVWKTPISMEMQECGSPGARWLSTQKKIVVCYEIIREFVQLHRSYGQVALVPGPMQMSKNQKVIASARPNSRSANARPVQLAGRTENPGGAGYKKKAKKGKKKR